MRNIFTTSNDDEKLRLLSIFGLGIVYINEQTEEMQLIAIINDIMSYKYIRNPSEKVKATYIELKLAL